MKGSLEPLGIIVLGAVVVKLTALLFVTAVSASIAAAFGTDASTTRPIYKTQSAICKLQTAICNRALVLDLACANQYQVMFWRCANRAGVALANSSATGE